MTLPSTINKVHFIGIGGYGMSALAFILMAQGYKVSGSDLKKSALSEALAEQGAVVTIGHEAANLHNADMVIYSTAIEANNPELKEAAHRGLPCWHRSQLLAALLNSTYGIAIAGAHGKTTTTAMVSLLLEAGNLDPTVIIGGVLPAYGSNARLGSGHYLVAEADESDSSFTRYYPSLAVVTGIEPDHLEHYEHNYERLKEAYVTFLRNLDPAGIAVLCADDPALRKLAGNLSCRKAWYSKSESPDEEKTEIGQDVELYHAKNIILNPGSSMFDFYRGKRMLAGRVKLSVPGLHNISNAVAALAVVDSLEIDPARCYSILSKFHGVGRRFEKIGEARGIQVIDDYAHHPTEVKATLEAARLSGKRVLCLFQPHRYSRTAAFFDEFSSAFRHADRLYLHAVYPAGEEPLPGVNAAALAERIREKSGIPVAQNDDLAALEAEITQEARPGDLIITMGAGDITYAAGRILNLLRQQAI